jgi:hypothetical protein
MSGMPEGMSELRDSFVIPRDDWKLQIDHNEEWVRFSIIDGKGTYRHISLTHKEAAAVSAFLAKHH